MAEPTPPLPRRNRTDTARLRTVPAPESAERIPAGEAPADPEGFEVLHETPPQGLVRRFFTTWRHFLGLVGGALVAWVRERPPAERGGIVWGAAWLLALLWRPFLSPSLVKRPFPVQLRKRLESLGTTYVKLGQILALRQDLLPEAITDELENLLDRLPVVPFPRYLELVAATLGRSPDEVFAEIDPMPIGSASIAQTHRGRLVTGESVVLKLVKPGIAETLHRDARLLWLLGHGLHLFFARFQIRQILAEFVEYTLREVDLTLEADNAETFAANFRDEPGVVFPRIYRHATTKRLLTMELLDGFKPTSPKAERLGEEEKDRLIDLGAGAVIRMIYRDGFFHADLHPGNLMILPGDGGGEARLGFIDLGMVGRFSEELRRTLLFFFYCLVTHDPENAARYLAAVARPGPGADPQGFRRAVTEILMRWQRAASFEEFSMGQLIMMSVGRGAQYRMYFPVEAVLMVKAIVTYEGVGHILKPGFDVAAVSQAHVYRILLHKFSPLRIAREGLRGAPELIDAMVRAPMVLSEGLRFFEQHTQRVPPNPFAGIRGTLFGGFCILSAAILLTAGVPWYWAAALALVGVVLALKRGG